MTGPSCAVDGNCSTGNGAEWCNWLSYGKASVPNPYPSCATFAPPTPATMPYPPRVGGGLNRAGDAWGVAFHANEWSGHDAELDMVAAAFKIVRLDMSWGSVEQQGACGTYNFSQYDSAVALWTARGVQPMFILDYFSPCYESGQPCTTTDCIDAYAAFGEAAMSHYVALKTPVIFECQNEPQGPPFWPNANGTVLAMMCYGVRARAAAANQLQYFVGPTTSWFDYVYITAVTEACGFNAFHSWSIHPYRSQPPESAIPDLSGLADFVAQAGVPTLTTPLPVLSSEWGYTSAAPAGCDPASNAVVTPMDQGKFLSRMFLTGTLIGAPFFIWYDWKNDSPNPGDCESNFGSVNATYRPPPTMPPFQAKPAYLAAATMQAGIGNGTFVGRVNATVDHWSAQATDVFVLQFDGANSARGAGYPSFAVWTNVSMCSSEGPRYPCGDPGQLDLYGCLAAGCCYDEASSVSPCYAYPFAEEPLQAVFNVPAPAAQDACFDITDFAGYARGQTCAVGGILVANVTDGPAYFL